MGYPPTTTADVDQDDVQVYLDVLLRVRAAFPDLPIEQQQGIADRAQGGPRAFTLERVVAAAQELVRAENKVWEQLFPSAQNTYIGTALRVLAAGHTDE
ncbi:hypothetical protein [Lentzea sp. NBRC 102530]|uniref:hypothetical protein n=1 Tax=Lentzea sp. NBRC 102530 TaxID=3032201 RepID=UPI0024A24087|nr:hypothetical protein [Lentzea sp. NBRC 102530]GLY54881.1 hypothetical protein Lesp01_85360 [Lentzea sp. NBRC 102530]